MTIALGLEPEERRQGQMAHDFEMALGAPETVLMLAERIGTSPALSSRLLQRLETYAGEKAAAKMRARAVPVTFWRRGRSMPCRRWCQRCGRCPIRRSI